MCSLFIPVQSQPMTAAEYALIAISHRRFISYKYKHIELILDRLLIYSISQEICTQFLLSCALLWLYIDWFSHIHQASHVCIFLGIYCILKKWHKNPVMAEIPQHGIYSISQEICTRFCCALLCCGYAIVHNEFTWSIYPYSSGLLCWHWGNR